MGIKELYKMRDRKALETVGLFLLLPDPGLIVRSIIETKKIDILIRKEVLKEEQPIVVVCSKDCKDNQGNS